MKLIDKPPKTKIRAIDILEDPRTTPLKFRLTYLITLILTKQPSKLVGREVDFLPDPKRESDRFL